MRIFITGLSGLFGLNAALVLGERHEIWGSFLTHPVELPNGRALQMDVRDRDAVLRAFREVRPDVVIHAAAATSVDACEEDPVMAEEMNVGATHTVVRAAADCDVRAKLVHLSTDQVFDGTAQVAKRESETRRPVNVYGNTKLKSEDVAVQADAMIIRTNFFGWGPPHKPSLSDWILTQLRKGAEVPGFEDVFFTPILVNDLIERIEIMMVSREHGDRFHVAGAERVSKYEFARRLAQQFGLNPEQVRPTRVVEAQLRAMRPLDMSLDGSKANELFNLDPAKLQFGLARLKELEVRRWPERIQHMLVQPRQVPA